MVVTSKLISDYIWGNDIENYDIDELENNPKFMLEVMKHSKDKNMYDYFCSEEVKKDYEFVKGLIEIFSDDIDFLKKICGYYLEDSLSLNVHDQLTIKDIRDREIIVLMNNLISSKGIENDGYQLYAGLIYSNLVLQFDICKEFEEDDEGLRELQMGFYLYKELYKDSNTIVDYIAMRMLKKIFYEDENLCFEDLIHKYYNNGSITKDKGIYNFIIAYVSMYDSYLADYVASHIELAKDIELGIKIMEANWDKYVDSTNRRKKEIFYGDVLKTIDKYDLSGIFDVDDVIDYVVELLHLEDFFSKYDSSRIGMFGEEDAFGHEIVDEELERDYFNIRTMKKTPIEYKCLKEIIESAKALFYSEIIEIKYDDYDEEKTSVFDGKVISFDSYQRRKRASK